MYSNDEERAKRLRGFVLAVLGSFAFAFSSVAILAVTHQTVYLLQVAALSLASILLIYLAVRSFSVLRQSIYLVSASICLAADASVVLLYFPQIEAALYTLVTFVGSSLALKGIRDIETHPNYQNFSERRKEIREIVDEKS